MDVELTPRAYQQSIYDSIMRNGNTLVVLPTGLGKTLIGLMLIKERMAKGRCLFLTPTKPLARQHAETIAKVLGLTEKNVSLVNGEIIPKKRKEMYQTDVIVSTPQTIRNDLEGGILNPDFSLAIFDECHRSVGNYAYTYVAEKLSGGRKAGERALGSGGKDSDGRSDGKGSAIKNEPCLFVGLTASPGGKMERIREVMGALRIDNVEIRDQNDPDVAQYVQKSVMTWVPVDLSDHFRDIKRELDSLTGKYAKRLSGMGFPPPLKHKGKFMELRQRILNIPSPIKYAALVQYSVLLHLLHMTELLETQGIYPVRDYLLKLEGKEGKSAKMLLHEPQLSEIRRLCEKEEDHPKMPVLLGRLKALAEGKKKVIVFAQYRSQIARIEKVLNENGISARQFVGKKDGVTKKIQEEAIADFRAGKFDVMVASSIAEEGLDIPAVDAVIFYEPIPSEIRSIQRRGRAARLKEGEIIVLMTRGTRDEFYYHASRNREGRMKTILKGMQKGKRDKENVHSQMDERSEAYGPKKNKSETIILQPGMKDQAPDIRKSEIDVVDQKTLPAKSASRAKKTADHSQKKMTDFL